MQVHHKAVTINAQILTGDFCLMLQLYGVFLHNPHSIKLFAISSIARAAAAWAAMENLALSAKPLSTKKWIEKCPQSPLKLNPIVTSSKRLAAKNNIAIIRFRSLEIWWECLCQNKKTSERSHQSPSKNMTSSKKLATLSKQHSDLTDLYIQKCAFKANLFRTNIWTRK